MQAKAIPLTPHSSITTRVEAITPEIASQLLGTMAGNRSLRKRIVNRYAREMIAGKWQVNGEAIKISRAGKVLDGQHRLQAVIEAQRTVHICVTRGLDDGAIVTIDTGIGRSYHDTNVIRGKSTSPHVGPIARWFYRYEMGSPTVAYTPTHQELDDVVDRHPSIPASAEFIQGHGLKVLRKRCLPSVQGFIHAYVSEMWDRETADIYAHTLNDGTNLLKSNPIFLLRRKLVDEDATRLEPSRILAFSIKAFNAWVAGKEMQLLTWATGGEKPEPFPRFKRDITPQAVINTELNRRKFVKNLTGENSPQKRRKARR